jgi:hypothetical protein
LIEARELRDGRDFLIVLGDLEACPHRQVLAVVTEEDDRVLEIVLESSTFGQHDLTHAIDDEQNGIVRVLSLVCPLRATPNCLRRSAGLTGSGLIVTVPVVFMLPPGEIVQQQSSV